MSVINQMLKELEERKGIENNNSHIGPTKSHTIPSSKLKIILIILLIIFVNVVGLYVWSLYSENKTLKDNVLPKSQVSTELHHSDTNNISQLKNIEKPKVEIETIKNTVNPEIQSSQFPEELENNVAVQEVVRYEGPKVPEELKQTPPITYKENIVVTPLNDNIKEVSINTEVKTERISPKDKPSTLSISRSNLSPERVVQNKLNKAERAITDNEVEKAEKLFEDVLLIQPEHKGARKQLSALWFGRKLFQPALNLLSQGIDIYPHDIDFRLMKARIYLNQNNSRAALDVLNGFATAQHVEYQVLLANTAQSVDNSNSAILAYRQLVALEPHKGKWWMGLAVALDRDSQFEEAKVTYQAALSAGNLSSHSAEFIIQRMSELGE